MFKFGMLTTAEELTRHWPDIFMIQALSVMVHGVIMAQCAVCGAFFVAWMAVRVQSEKCEGHETGEHGQH